jgi:hypothetical protein
MQRVEEADGCLAQHVSLTEKLLLLTLLAAADLKLLPGSQLAGTTRAGTVT